MLNQRVLYFFLGNNQVKMVVHAFARTDALDTVSRDQFVMRYLGSEKNGMPLAPKVFNKAPSLNSPTSRGLIDMRSSH